MSTNCSALNRPVHVSLGAYGRISHLLAIAQMLAYPPEEPLLGKLSTERVQLCPQNHGTLDVEVAKEIRRLLPHIEWRLHANVRVDQVYRWIDIGDWPQQRDYFDALAAVSKALDAPAYSAHAGRRDRATLVDVLNYARQLAYLFGVPVAIEGHYPTVDDFWLISSWREYQTLFESGVPYALDLSHLHILARQTGRYETGLLQEMLACERCLEVHISSNNGQADQHRPITEKPWWFPLLKKAHSKAVVFSEGRLPVRKALEEAA